jgi:hypothetical protein
VLLCHRHLTALPATGKHMRKTDAIMQAGGERKSGKSRYSPPGAHYSGSRLGPYLPAAPVATGLDPSGDSKATLTNLNPVVNDI